MYFDLYRFRWFFTALGAIILAAIGLYIVNAVTATPPPPKVHIVALGPVGAVLAPLPASATTPEERAAIPTIQSAQHFYTLGTSNSFTQTFDKIQSREQLNYQVVTPLGEYPGFSSLVKLRGPSGAAFCVQVAQGAGPVSLTPAEIVACP